MKILECILTCIITHTTAVLGKIWWKYIFVNFKIFMVKDNRPVIFEYRLFLLFETRWDSDLNKKVVFVE